MNNNMPELVSAAAEYPSRRYYCDLRYSDTEEDGRNIVPVIFAEFPTIWLRAVEDHFSVPSIPTGRVRVTVGNVSPELHDAIRDIPGVEVAP